MGQLIAGPFAAKTLADFGAEVIKIEPVGSGDPLRKWRLLKNGTSVWWQVQSRNKRSIALDLRNPEGQRIAKKLIGQDSQIEKEYLVRIVGNLTAEGLAKLNFGLTMDGKPLKRAQVGWLNKEQLRFILHEGKKRQIRRMCEMVGVRVAGLKRVRIGRVMLGDLPLGQWRYLGADEKF